MDFLQRSNTKYNYESHYKGLSLVEQIAISVSINLVIIIGSTIMLLMICGFIYRRCTYGKWCKM